MSKHISRYIVLVLIFPLFFGCSTEKKKKEKDMNIIPKPVSQKQLKSEFILGGETKIISESSELKQSADFLQNYIAEKYGLQTEVSEETADENYILLSVTDTMQNKEGYRLQVMDSGIEITGASGDGVFYGIQTFLQLLPAKSRQKEQIAVQAADITDYPRFEWRGMHLDVCRHFFSVDFIKKMLDVMAMHKFNKFHWHLTEDQGWRIEIKQYPKLTEIGAWRDSTIKGHVTEYPAEYDTSRYGGYYTQEEIKEVVQYAQERNITVVPEIEMPGHARAALAAYPELACTEGPFEVATKWGIFEDIYCAGKEQTFEFLTNVLDEVIQLFPGKYIHIGGDEAPKARWKECGDCQRRIREEGLKDEKELQSYFIKRIEKYLNSKGKKLIGWDEIIEGGLPERATVMSWRGIEGGIEAAETNHHAVMTPTSHCYFDYYQGKYQEPLSIGGYLPLSKVYDFEPVPDELEEEKSEYILGGQANLWTEYVPTSDHAEYMLFPRLSAMAEVLWSQKSQKNWDDFLKRMDAQYYRLDYHDINYRIDYPANYGRINRYMDDSAEVTLDNAINESEIRYTTDGSEPTKNSNLYSGPITLNLESPVTLKSRTFMPNGKKSSVHTGKFTKMEWKESVSPESPKAGINYSYYATPVKSTKDIQGEADKTGVIDSVKFPEDIKETLFALRYDGYIKVPEKAVYNFNLNSVNGGALFIDDMKVVDNDGLSHYHQNTGKVALEKGFHKITVKYYQGKYWRSLNLGCQYNDNEMGAIPASWFYH